MERVFAADLFLHFHLTGLRSNGAHFIKSEVMICFFFIGTQMPRKAHFNKIFFCPFQYRRSIQWANIFCGNSEFISTSACINFSKGFAGIGHLTLAPC
jgi:hypothetical protein